MKNTINNVIKITILYIITYIIGAVIALMALPADDTVVNESNEEE